MSVLGTFILPHPPVIIRDVGRGDELKIQKTLDAYESVAKKIASLKPSTIVICSPHSTMYSNYIHISPGQSAHGDLWKYNAPNAKADVKYNTAFVDKLCEICKQSSINAGTDGEKHQSLDHGTLLPLLFINKYYTDYTLVRTGISGLPLDEHYLFGNCIAKTADALKESIVFIASGDLSHKLKESGPYGFSEDGAEFDRIMLGAMKSANFIDFLELDPNIRQGAAECGLAPIVIMAGCLDGKGVATTFLSYEYTFGVGYAVCYYTVTGADANRSYYLQYMENQKKLATERKVTESPCVRLARIALETYIKTGKIIDVPTDTPAGILNNRAGVFVSLKKYGELRGCIGTIEPTRTSIAEEIINNAISAGVSDPRFDGVTASELNFLAYSVDILGKCMPTTKEGLDVEKYGVVVKSGTKRGLLLPNLDGIDTVDKQLEIALEKARINSNANYTIERFEVIRYK